MKRVAGLVMIAVGMAYGYVDFGKQGALYEIAEPDLQKVIQKRVADLNVTEIKRKARESAVSARTYHNTGTLPVCTADYDFTREDMQVAPRTVRDVDGTVLVREGDPVDVSLPAGIVKDYCIVDGRKRGLLDIQVEYFEEHYPACTYLLTDMDIFAFEEAYPAAKRRVYPLNDRLVERFGVECLPARLRMYDNTIEHHYLNLPEEE